MLDQENFYLIFFSILITRFLDNVWMYREVTCSLLLRYKSLKNYNCCLCNNHYVWYLTSVHRPLQVGLEGDRCQASFGLYIRRVCSEFPLLKATHWKRPRRDVVYSRCFNFSKLSVLNLRITFLWHCKIHTSQCSLFRSNISTAASHSLSYSV